jgi:hypothetical protein
MKKELAEQFSQEVESYRRSLLYYAKTSEWEEFKASAGRLFDYVESVEYSELERRFFKTFTPILAVLGLVVLALFGVDFEVYTEWQGLRNAFILSALTASSFELYFYLDFRIYVRIRTAYSGKRRESFIRNIEQDFRGFVRRPESLAA